MEIRNQFWAVGRLLRGNEICRLPFVSLLSPFPRLLSVANAVSSSGAHCRFPWEYWYNVISRLKVLRLERGVCFKRNNNGFFVFFCLLQQQRPDLPRLLQQMHAQQVPAPPLPVPLLPHAALPPPAAAAAAGALLGLAAGPHHPLSAGVLAAKPPPCADLHRQDEKPNNGKWNGLTPSGNDPMQPPLPAKLRAMYQVWDVTPSLFRYCRHYRGRFVQVVNSRSYRTRPPNCFC